MFNDALFSVVFGWNSALVLDREILEDDRIAYTLQYDDRVKVIKDVPEEVTVESLKRLLEGIGDYAHDEWKYSYRVVFYADLDDNIRKQIEQDIDVFMEFHADYPKTYDELLDRLGEEKRITLRVPMGLHTMLVSACKGKSLNTFCMEALSKAVGYEALPTTAAKKD